MGGSSFSQVTPSCFYQFTNPVIPRLSRASTYPCTVVHGFTYIKKHPLETLATIDFPEVIFSISEFYTFFQQHFDIIFI